MSVELELTLKGSTVLSMDLVGEGPEDTLPNETGLGILQSQIVFIIHRLRRYNKVEVSNVEPETDDNKG